MRVKLINRYTSTFEEFNVLLLLITLAKNKQSVDANKSQPLVNVHYRYNHNCCLFDSSTASCRLQLARVSLTLLDYG